MKIRNIFNRLLLCAGVMGLLGGTVACNYLDIVPPEQVDVDDAMENYENALGFLYSCYAFSKNNSVGELPYGNYLSEINTTADDILNPHAWASDGSAACILLNTLSSQNAPDYWGHNYNGIGQCLLFLQKMDECQILERGVIDAATDREWRAEMKALMAYYHFVILRRYGPIAILEEKLPLGAPQSSFPGRYHFDYCVDWIVNQLDEAAADLPAKRDVAYMGRMTSTICKAIKAKVLLLAASPLYNGSFPYPDFKNTNWETPGYGQELISHTYDASKWNRAYAAANEAINWAENQGDRAIYRGNEYINANIDLDDLYIPGGASDEFKAAVLRMRYLHYACENEGNREAIMTTIPDALTTQWLACFPKKIMQLNNGNMLSGYSGHNPTLFAVTHFLTENGLLPENDPDYTSESDWYKSAGLGADGADRDRIINLCVGREPRFYAWIGFDGGDYSLRIKDGEPVRLNMLDKDLQGYNTSTRDNSVTGFMTQKFMPPVMQIAKTNAYVGYVAPSRAVIRLAELYLIRAECEAQLGMTDEAIRDVNVIRERAGAKPLTASMIGAGGMSLLDWVKNERICEFFAEGKRYFDIRRYVEGDKYLGLGKRMGLNALAKENPSFEEFNQPTRLPYNYTWANKLYLYPIQYGDVYANPQLVQNPGF